MNSADYRRFALYYAPAQESELAQFGANWLGYCPVQQQEVPFPALPWTDTQHQKNIQAAARYGFHGTLKPPFYLAAGYDAKQLDQQLTIFCQLQASVTTGPLQLSQIGSFLALTPTEPLSALAELASDCVTKFDDFRAAPSDAELARRRQKTLSPAQEQYLHQWGYPYVLDCFRFHLTLSGALPPAQMSEYQSILSDMVAPLTKNPFEITEICLFGEPDTDQAQAPFHLLKRYRLQG